MTIWFSDPPVIETNLSLAQQLFVSGKCLFIKQRGFYVLYEDDEPEFVMVNKL